jgi:succinate dehydrogenase/fumarate reductase flavoprotein subunit
VETRVYDVVVIGAGGAGITAAAAAARAGARVAILSKEPLACGNTRIAFGGLSAAGVSPGDSAQELFQDLMAGGEGLGRPELVRLLAETSSAAVSIAEGLGHLFRRDSEGDIKGRAVGQTGGHRFNRTVSSPGQGVALGQALRSAAFRSGVDLLEETVAFRLLVEDRVQGLMAFRLRDGEVLALAAGAVVMACGGAGWLYYPHTDCLRPSTGDGFALALEAGAELIGMEFMQFLPFAATHPDSYMGIFLGEPTTAGPQGRLINGKGQVVLTNMMRLTRAQVARVLAQEMNAGNTTPHGGLTLDLSPNLETPQGRAAWSKLRELGLLDQVKAIYGERAFRWEEPWDVAPTAHFSAGGILVGQDCQSRVPGLFAAGETAGGAHGADRLGGMALTEVFVFGEKAGQEAATYAGGLPSPDPDPVEVEKESQRVASLLGRRGSQRPIALIERLQQLMWQKVGVVRTEEGLGQALEAIRGMKKETSDLSVAPYRVFNTELAEALELGMMLVTAEAMARSALERRESRGGHIRLDFPERNDQEWRKNIILWKEGAELRVRTEEALPKESQP